MQESSRVSVNRRLCEYGLSITLLRGCVFIQRIEALYFLCSVSGCVFWLGILDLRFCTLTVEEEEEDGCRMFLCSATVSPEDCLGGKYPLV